MAMEIHGLGTSPAYSQTPQQQKPDLKAAQQRIQQQTDQLQQKIRESQAEQTQKIQEAVDQMDRFAKNINKKLSYSFNRDLNQVVVKVVDAKTDKVIKELPPAELQKLHLRIQEYIGMIIDETA